MHPNGMPACKESAVAHSDARWHPFRMRFFWGALRWCRCAQPPANRSDASGIRFLTFYDLGPQRLSQSPSLRGSFDRGFLTSQRYDFLLPSENSEEPRKPSDENPHTRADVPSPALQRREDCVQRSAGAHRGGGLRGFRAIIAANVGGLALHCDQFRHNL
jgi:hypothetical protein